MMDQLRLWGCDIDGALERVADDETLLLRCMEMFREDPGFSALEEALKGKDYSAAFDAAHMLKGVAANLGITPLYRAAGKLVESLRHKEYAELEPLYRDFTAAKERFFAIVDASHAAENN